jgi:hypothetical protein
MNSAVLNICRKVNRGLLAYEGIWHSHWQNLVHCGLAKLGPEYMLVEVGIEHGVIEWSNWKHLHHSLSFAGILEF